MTALQSSALAIRPPASQRRTAVPRLKDMSGECSSIARRVRWIRAIWRTDSATHCVRFCGHRSDQESRVHRSTALYALTTGGALPERACIALPSSVADAWPKCRMATPPAAGVWGQGAGSPTGASRDLLHPSCVGCRARTARKLIGVEAPDIVSLLAIVAAGQERTARQIASLEAVVATIVEGSELVSTDDEHDPEGALSPMSGRRPAHCCDKLVPTSTRWPSRAGSSSWVSRWSARTAVVTLTSSVSLLCQPPLAVSGARPDPRVPEDPRPSGRTTGTQCSGWRLRVALPVREVVGSLIVIVGLPGSGGSTCRAASRSSDGRRARAGTGPAYDLAASAALSAALHRESRRPRVRRGARRRRRLAARRRRVLARLGSEVIAELSRKS